MTNGFSDDERIIVANSMIRRGGGFVRKLGRALMSADPVNVQKIKGTFPEYWQKYLDLGIADGDIDG